MAVVKVNRELLGDVVQDLNERHQDCKQCTNGRVCPTGQRLARIMGIMIRSPEEVPK